ncbi:MAG: Nif3-like dinuclear metal center hexameric protein [Clostridia bacterium]|nr:Nif3-like dinuclear metal center hexameric protein [Clostridia bacterium]
MIKNKDIYDFLCEKYPLNTACDFDNPGFLVGDEDIKADRVLVTLDCDLKAVQSAKALGCNLIITHHPVIFDPLKTVTKGSVVFELIENGISVISMHTNLDIGECGVNDCLCKALHLKNVEIFEAADGFKLRKGVSDESDPDRLAESIKKQLGGTVRYVAGRPIKNALVCSGSGGDFLADAIKGGFDALITSDVKHNVFLDALNAGISLFDAGHYHTENVVIDPLCDMLKARFNDIEFIPFENQYIKGI